VRDVRGEWLRTAQCISHCEDRYGGSDATEKRADRESGLTAGCSGYGRGRLGQGYDRAKEQDPDKRLFGAGTLRDDLCVPVSLTPATQTMQAAAANTAMFAPRGNAVNEIMSIPVRGMEPTAPYLCVVARSGRRSVTCNRDGGTYAPISRRAHQWPVLRRSSGPAKWYS